MGHVLFTSMNAGLQVDTKFEVKNALYFCQKISGIPENTCSVQGFKLQGSTVPGKKSWMAEKNRSIKESIAIKSDGASKY